MRLTLGMLREMIEGEVGRAMRDHWTDAFSEFRETLNDRDKILWDARIASINGEPISKARLGREFDLSSPTITAYIDRINIKLKKWANERGMALPPEYDPLDPYTNSDKKRMAAKTKYERDPRVKVVSWRGSTPTAMSYDDHVLSVGQALYGPYGGTALIQSFDPEGPVVKDDRTNNLLIDWDQLQDYHGWVKPAGRWKPRPLSK